MRCILIRDLLFTVKCLETTNHRLVSGSLKTQVLRAAFVFWIASHKDGSKGTNFS